MLSRAVFLMLIFTIASILFVMKEVAATGDDYKYVDIVGGVEITEYVGTSKEVTIPDELDN